MRFYLISRGEWILMNILCYTNKLNNGGAERVMSILVNGLYHRGHKVILVNDYQFRNEYQIESSIEHYYIDGVFQQKSGNAWSRNIKRIIFLRKICKKQKIDVVLSFISDANFRALIATVGLRTKNVISVRIDPATAYKSKKRAMAAKFFYSFAEGCVFQTQQAKNWYPFKIQKHSEVILNPVSDSFYNTIGYPGSEKRIVATGRLSKQKRFDILIDAFAIIHPQFPDYILEIYGEGELKEQLQSQINNLRLKDKIVLKGRSEQIYEDIKNASIFVLSSDFEGLPNSLMEAMALGLPCVSTDCDGGGARTLISDKENGLLIETGNCVGLASSLSKLIENPEICSSLGKAAKRKAEYFKSDIIEMKEKRVKK